MTPLLPLLLLLSLLGTASATTWQHVGAGNPSSYATADAVAGNANAPWSADLKIDSGTNPEAASASACAAHCDTLSYTAPQRVVGYSWFDGANNGGTAADDKCSCWVHAAGSEMGILTGTYGSVGSDPIGDTYCFGCLDVLGPDAANPVYYLGEGSDTVPASATFTANDPAPQGESTAQDCLTHCSTPAPTLELRGFAWNSQSTVCTCYTSATLELYDHLPDATTNLHIYTLKNEAPSLQPSFHPSESPSLEPSESPSLEPSYHPSEAPSLEPSDRPSEVPSLAPSESPSYQPSMHPSEFPSLEPSESPSDGPSMHPSQYPSLYPSLPPSEYPSSQPSHQPSSAPSSLPSEAPSSIPSHQPSSEPSSMPSQQPSSRPSGQPTSMPSETPSAQPSCTPSSAPSDPETTFLFYPDWSPGGEGCRNDGEHPAYMAANPSSYLSSTLAKCCSTYYSWNYDGCMGHERGTCSRALFYPDWAGDNEGCIDDGNEPDYMTDNAVYYMFSQLQDCCQEHYQWNYESCVGTTSSQYAGMYYPDYDDNAHVCKNNGEQPGYMNNSPSHWLHSTLADCCSTNYQWNYAACVGSDPTSTPATSPTSPTASPGLYYPDWLSSDHVCRNDNGQPAYMTNNPTLWMHSTLAACCTKNYSWNYDNCVAAETTPATAPTAAKYFMSYALQTCILDGGGQGNAQTWDTLYDTLSDCCREKAWWNDDCDD